MTMGQYAIKNDQTVTELYGAMREVERARVDMECAIATYNEAVRQYDAARARLVAEAQGGRTGGLQSSSGEYHRVDAPGAPRAGAPRYQEEPLGARPVRR